MSFEKEIKLVEELCMTPGISGHEEKIAEIIKRELKDVADDIETDLMGNVIATKKGSDKKGPKVMLAAHMDEIGLMVRYIDDNGYIISCSGDYADIRIPETATRSPIFAS